MLYFLEKTLTLGMDLLFLCTMLLTKPPSLDLTECLIQHHGTLHSTVSNLGAHFTAKEVCPWSMLIAFIGLAMLPPPPFQSSCSARMVTWPCEDSVTDPA